MKITQPAIEVKHAFGVLFPLKLVVDQLAVSGQHIMFAENRPVIVLQIKGMVCKHGRTEFAR